MSEGNVECTEEFFKFFFNKLLKQKTEVNKQCLDNQQ